MDDINNLFEEKKKDIGEIKTDRTKEQEYRNPVPEPILINDQRTGDKKEKNNAKILEEVRGRVEQNMLNKYSPRLKKTGSEGSLGKILGLYDDLLATEKSSDSFAMSMVKDRLFAISDLYSDGKNKDKTYRALRAREVTALLFACENYRTNRFSDGVPKNERHRIVSKLIKEADSYLKSEDPSIMGLTATVDFHKPREAMYELRDSRGMSGMLSQLNHIDNLLEEKPPQDEEDFDLQKEMLLLLYEDLIADLRKHTADTARMTDFTKQRYRVIANALVSLSAERDRLSKMQFKRGGKSWKSLFVTEKGEGAARKAPMLYAAVGVDLYLKEGDTDHKTIAEIAQIAKGIEICYSNKTMFDLTSIQIIDAIAGIRNRTQDTLAFRYRRKRTGGRHIIELYDVKVKSTGISGFGTHDKLYSPVPEAYDIDFVKALVKLTPEKLIQTMEKSGYAANEVEREALKKRFTVVKKSLKDDMKTTQKSWESMMDVLRMDETATLTLVDRSFVGDGYTSETTKRVRLESGGLKEEEKLPENPSENELMVRTLNAKADELSNSSKLRLKRKELIAGKVNEILSGDVSKPVKEICKLILSYVDIDATASDIHKNIAKKYFMDEAEKRRIKLDYDVSELFPLDYTGSKSHAVNNQAPEVKKTVPDWAAGMDDIQKEKLLIYQITSAIASYKKSILDFKADLPVKKREGEKATLDTLLGLFSFSKGNLDVEHIPAGAKRIRDTGITYKSDGKELTMIDQRWAPLFEHEPCLEDVVQGYLGDCYFLGSIASIVEKNPAFIKEMMHDDGDTVTVRLYDTDKKPVYLTMEKKLPEPNVNREDRFARGSFWVMYLEKAITLMQTGTIRFQRSKLYYERVIKEGVMRNSRYYDHVRGGFAKEIIPIITGNDVDEISVTGKDDKSATAKLTDEEIQEGYRRTVERVVSYIEAAQSAGKAIVAATGTFSTDSAGKGINAEAEAHGLYATHQYAVLGIEEIRGKKMIKLRNPWGGGRMRYEVQKATDVPVIRWADRADPGAFYVTPERFVAIFGDINTVDMKPVGVEDMLAEEGDIAYEFKEDKRAKKTIRLHTFEKKKKTSSFDLEKWDDTLRSYVNTEKKGVEKKKYKLFLDAKGGEYGELKKTGIVPGKIRLYSSLGDVYYNDRKENVLQFDLAGTNEDEASRGIDISMRMDAPDYKDKYESHYGKVVEGYENVRKKEIRPEGGPIKTRYNFGGAGTFNGGENSMQNVEERIDVFAREWLRPLLDEMVADETKRKPTHVMLTGFSRGASAESAGLMRLSKWLHDNYEEAVSKYVLFEVVFQDSTPGFGSRSGIYDKAEIASSKSYDKDGKETEDDEKKVYRGVSENLSATAIYTLKSGLRAFLDPQKVIGADRVIISPFEHNEIDPIDTILENQRTLHRRAFIDPLTGCAYRGSGVNALPKGFYFADADNFLIRVDSYADFKNLLGKLLAGVTKDSLRTAVIDEVAREFFSRE